MADILMLPYLELPYHKLLKHLLESDGNLTVTTSWRFPSRGIILDHPFKVIHIHMLDMLFLHQRTPLQSITAFAWFLFVLRPLMYFRQIRLVWTCHELASHSLTGLKSFLNKLYTAVFVYVSDKIIVHSVSLEVEIKKNFPLVDLAKVTWIPHGSLASYYSGVIPVPISPLDESPFLNHTFGIIGYLRENKQILEVIRAFRASNQASSRLLVIGVPTSSTYFTRLCSEASLDPRISVISRNLSDGEVVWLHHKLRALLFGPSLYPTSGSIETALSLGSEVVASKTGYLAEILNQWPQAKLNLYTRVDELPALLNRLSAQPFKINPGHHPHPFDFRLWLRYRQVYFV